jgi:hypothetical protein
LRAREVAARTVDEVKRAIGVGLLA